jgi:hypothetical protein
MLKSNFKKPLNIIDPKLKNIKGISVFDFEQMPVAYFADNKNAIQLRKNLIKNELKISECNIGDLENTFFSQENMDLINKQLILNVYKKTQNQFLICRQDERSLIIVMRYVFIEYSRNLPFDILNQIKELNNIVVSEITATVISNVDQKIGYLRDIKTQPIGPPLPINTKSTNRSLPTTANFF